MNAADRTSRLLTLLPWLRARPGVAVAEAAAHFEVSEQALLADLALLTYVGPGQAGGDLVDIAYEPGGSITVISSQGLDLPLRLSPTEAAALLAGLSLLAQLPTPAGSDAVARAAAKLQAAAGDAAEVAAGIAVHVDPIDPAVSAGVADALAQRRLVRMRYRGADGGLTERDADPLRLLALDGRSYLEAWCRRAEGVRLFRLDRIESLEVLAVPADPPADAVRFDPAVGLLGDGRPVTLDLDPEAGWVVEAHPVSTVEHRTDGTLRAVLPVADERWLVRLVLSMGGAVRVVEPPEVRDAARSAARRALAGYRPTIADHSE